MSHVLMYNRADRDRLDLESGEQTVLSTHEAPVKAVVYSKETCT